MEVKTLKKISFVTQFLSIAVTVLLCILPVAILIEVGIKLGFAGFLLLFFIIKKSKNYFSNYRNLQDFASGKLDLKNLKGYVIKVILLSTIWIILCLLMLSFHYHVGSGEFSITLIAIITLALLLICASVAILLMFNLKNGNFSDFKNVSMENAPIKTEEIAKDKTKALLQHCSRIKLTSNEIIIISTIVGALMFGYLGWYFGSNERNDLLGREEFVFNYISAFIGFIVSAGLAYLLLNRFTLKQDADKLEK